MEKDYLVAELNPGAGVVLSLSDLLFASKHSSSAGEQLFIVFRNGYEREFRHNEANTIWDMLVNELAASHESR